MKYLTIIKAVAYCFFLIIGICFFTACEKGEPINRTDLTKGHWKLIEIRDGYNNMLMDSTEVCYSVWQYDSTSNYIKLESSVYHGEYEIMKNSLKVKLISTKSITESKRCTQLYDLFKNYNCGTISIQNDIMKYKISINKTLIFKRI